MQTGGRKPRRRQCSSSATTILRFAPAEPRLMRSSCTVTFASRESSTRSSWQRGARQCPWRAANTSGHSLPRQTVLQASTSSTRTDTTTTGLSEPSPTSSSTPSIYGTSSRLSGPTLFISSTRCSSGTTCYVRFETPFPGPDRLHAARVHAHLPPAGADAPRTGRRALSGGVTQALQ